MDPSTGWIIEGTVGVNGETDSEEIGVGYPISNGVVVPLTAARCWLNIGGSILIFIGSDELS